MITFSNPDFCHPEKAFNDLFVPQLKSIKTDFLDSVSVDLSSCELPPNPLNNGIFNNFLYFLKAQDRHFWFDGYIYFPDVSVYPTIKFLLFQQTKSQHIDVKINRDVLRFSNLNDHQCKFIFVSVINHIKIAIDSQLFL